MICFAHQQRCGETGGGGAGDIFLRDEGKSGMGKGSCGGTSDGG